MGTTSKHPSLTSTCDPLASLMSPGMLLRSPKPLLLRRPPAPWDRFQPRPHPWQHPLQKAQPLGEELCQVGSWASQNTAWHIGMARAAHNHPER